MPAKRQPKPTKHARLAAAIAASGWEVYQRAPGVYLATDPSSDVEHITPDWARAGGHWPGATYRKLRQLSYVIHEGRFVYVAARTCEAPWVRVSERTLSLAAALDFVGEPEVSTDRP